jgi:TPR repeat protein
VCFNNGRGAAKDPDEAVKWWRKAAEQGLAGAQFNLGECFMYGQGVAKDPDEAVKWYHKAAEQGHAKAREQLEHLTGKPYNDP